MRTKETTLPSGETAGARSPPSQLRTNGFRVRRRRPEPSVRMIQMPLSAGPWLRTKTICWPSGVKAGFPFQTCPFGGGSAPVGVSSRKPVPAGEISATEPLAGGVSYPKAISFPSGDQSGVPASAVPRVICVSFLPSGRMVNSRKWPCASRI